MTRRVAFVALACVVVVASPRAPRLHAQATEGTRLAAIVGEYLAARAVVPGLARGLSPDRMAVLSLDQTRQQAGAAAALLAKLKTVRASDLSHDDWLTYAILEFDLSTAADAERLFWVTIPVTPYSSPLRTLSSPFLSMPLRNSASLDAYLDALNHIPVVLAAYEAKLRSQMQRGIVLPAEELRLVIPFLRTLVVAPPRSDYNVSPERLKDVPDVEAAAFRAKVDDAIRTTVNPAIERLIAYIDGPYRAKASDRVGLGQYPGGPDAYRVLIRQHTGLDLTAEEIHEIGQSEVRRLSNELDKVRQEAGFAGSLQEFRSYLKTDRRFFPKSSAQIGEVMMAAIRRIEPKVDAFFLVKPKAPYGVKRLDESLEQSMTYGYYQLPSATDPMGYYRFNGSQPESRSRVMAAATIYHELVPGHHFQLALRRESTTLSPFRRSVMHTSFTEGWAEYSSDLAAEMGMFDGDPYARAGRLAMDLFLSTRLVVDTGMNALGWSRERAMTFMREFTLESDVQIDTETLRYSSDMPGQALAYKLGSRKIHELRRRTEAAQRSAFDIRRFHAHLLDHGSMPLGVLDQHVACLVAEAHTAR